MTGDIVTHHNRLSISVYVCLSHRHRSTIYPYFVSVWRSSHFLLFYSWQKGLVAFHPHSGECFMSGRRQFTLPHLGKFKLAAFLGYIQYFWGKILSFISLKRLLKFKVLILISMGFPMVYKANTNRLHVVVCSVRLRLNINSRSIRLPELND